MEPGDFDELAGRARSKGLTDRVDTSGGAEFGRETFRGDLVAHGQRLAAVHGCFKCHSIDGQPHIGPTWIDLYRRQTTLQTGRDHRRRRGLPDRVDDGAVPQDGEGLRSR